MNKEVKYLYGGIIFGILAIIGVTYAFFSASIVGDRKNVSVDMADLKIIFTNGDAIEANDISAEDNLDIVKSFSVENKTKNVYKYNIVIESLLNTFKTSGYLVYKITSNDGGYNMTEFEDVPKRSTASDTVLAYSINVPANTKHNYNIEIKYINSETVNQSADSNATLSGKLFISKGTPMPTLAEAMLRDNPTISERTDFSTPFTGNTTGTLYKTNKTEDGSNVYYYSGNTTNNWVKFGNFYWRIIRTNEDGGVRMLYSGANPETKDGHIGRTVYNDNEENPIYVGYMYGTSGTLSNNRKNTNDSTIKTYIDTWYQNNLLTNYDKYISKSAIYCNDRSVHSNESTNNDNNYSISDTFVYGANTRANNNSPTYKCGGDGKGGVFESVQAIEDKFSASTEGGGNGQLKYPVALMTVDELNYAGAAASADEMPSPYAWYYTNSQGESIMGTTEDWWTLSPYGWDGFFALVWFVHNSDDPGRLNYDSAQDAVMVRPTLSLSSCVTIKSGNGTPESPYEIDESSCS